jgi:hypothetical protein
LGFLYLAGVGGGKVTIGYWMRRMKEERIRQGKARNKIKAFLLLRRGRREGGEGDGKCDCGAETYIYLYMASR